ncbi:2'-5' RNA ligase family protein [Mucilaginibacter sp.]
MYKRITILTLIMDKASQEFFNKLRKQHFPAGRNYLDAHLTLFHNLPDEPEIINHVKFTCANTNKFVTNTTEIVSIGNGVAYKIISPELQLIHKHLQQQFAQWLIPQDKQKLWPHITIQNKTNADTANQLIKALTTNFQPFIIEALGLKLWEYKGGPWEFIDEFYFQH